MAKSTHKRPVAVPSPGHKTKSFVPVDKKAFDPALASLFASSLGPVEAPPKSRYENLIEKRPAKESSEEENDEEDDEELSSASDNSPSDSEDEEQNEDDDSEDSDDDANSSLGDVESNSEQSPSDNEVLLANIRESVVNGAQEKSNKKRKRGNKEEDVESAYMQKLAREEAKEEEERKKKQKTGPVQEEGEQDNVSDKSQDSDEEPFTIPKHETLMDAEEGNAEDLDKAQRTVFLGNVSSEAITSKSAQKTLMKHLASFIPDLADNKPPHKVESIRYRSTAFASALPKRAAFAKREIMDSTTKSTNAYAVYSTQVAAREAAKRLNGTVVLKRHLRVDSVAHPSKVDHRRCVFVGNLGFVDDESNMNAEEDGKKKNKPPADVEEGLWVHFAKAGKVESVRVIRDSKTRVGKGFAYVQFEDENAVEAALQLNDQKFPPMLPRKLRVARCKAEKKKDKKRGPPPSKSPTTKGKGVYNAKISDEQKSKQGRARAMLGKAGAVRSMESFVFEGHRASSKQGHSGLKLGGKKRGPNGRKQRSAAWKAGGKR